MEPSRQAKLTFQNGQLVASRSQKSPRNATPSKSLDQVARETKNVLPGLLLTRPDARPDGYLYDGSDVQQLDQKYCPKLPATRIRVVNSDTIDAALNLMSTAGVQQSYSTSTPSSSAKPICVLNMANAFSAGGGWMRGALAQEEALCYRTSLSFTLKLRYYPMPEESGIYSPRVLIIRESMKDGHDLLDCRVPQDLKVISVVSVAAIDRPLLARDPTGAETYRRQNDRHLMEEKIRIILRIAIRNQHRQIVLGAFGCGAFANPNQEVANMFRSVLTEPEFSGGWWKDVVFAVLDMGSGNFGVFHNALDGLQV